MRARKRGCLSGHCGWECQIIPGADTVEVTGSHVGLIFNRRVFRAVPDALA